MLVWDIRQGSEYALISEYTRVLNILGFWICQGYTRFWIKYFVIDVWQYSEYALDSEYATVLNMLGSHKVVNKIFHHKYLTGFWMCLEFWSHTFLTGFWVFPGLSICQGLNIQGSWICQGYTWFCVNCILKILSNLNVSSSEYAKFLNVSGV